MSRKSEPPRPPLARLLASCCVFREWAAVEIAAQIAQAGVQSWSAEGIAKWAVNIADALAAELERTGPGRADHPARQEEEA